MPEHPEDNLVVFAPENADIAKAAALAAHLRAPLTHDADRAVGAALALRCDCRGLTLMGDGMELQADFTRMTPRLKPGRLQRELLVRAARINGLRCHSRSGRGFAAPCRSGIRRNPERKRPGHRGVAARCPPPGAALTRAVRYRSAHALPRSRQHRGAGQSRGTSGYRLPGSHVPCTPKERAGEEEVPAAA